jgi:hypothetical protein
MKVTHSPTNLDCIRLIEERSDEFYDTLIEFLRCFEEHYRQAILTEFFSLEFDYLLN